MENKIILLLIIATAVLFFSVVAIYNHHQKPEPQQVYQGPVRLGDNLNHFRQTGETKPLEKTWAS